MVRVITPQLQAAGEAADRLVEEFDSSSQPTTLSNAVEDAYREAVAHKLNLGVAADLEYCSCSFKGEYTPDEKDRLGIDDSNNIYAPITRTKCMALMSWLYDIFANAEDKPWTLEPTPVPSLPDELQTQIELKLQMELQQAAAQGLEVTPDLLEERAKELVSLQYTEMQRVARRAIDRADKLLADLLEEGGWREAFKQLIHDLSVYPNAFIRGPFREQRMVLQWSGAKLVPAPKDIMRVERISPFDVFPAPDATTPQDGSYIIERMWMSAAALWSLTELDDPGLGLFPDEIKGLLRDNPDGYAYHLDGEEEGSKEEGQQDEGKRYEVVVYYGYIRREAVDDFLAKRNLSWSHKAATEVLDVECWVCDGRVLRLVVNEGSLLYRPIFSVSFLKAPGEFWGISLPIVLRDIQRAANACLRSLVENMAFSSAPMGEYDVDRMRNEEDIDELQPRRMYAIVNDVRLNQVANAPAMRFYSIDSHARELLAVYDRFVKEADDATGIPAYVIGSPQVAGAGRTLGGLSLLMGNAAKGVKRVVGYIDKDVIEPIVTQAYAIVLQHNPDASLKADAQVKARGASGLLQRELQQARAVEILQLLTPYVQIGAVPPSAIQVLLRDIVRSLGYPPDQLLPDPERQAELASFAPQAAPAAQPEQVNPTALPPELQALLGNGLDGAPPQPTLDGRQAVPPAPGEEEQVPPA